MIQEFFVCQEVCYLLSLNIPVHIVNELILRIFQLRFRLQASRRPSKCHPISLGLRGDMLTYSIKSHNLFHSTCKRMIQMVLEIADGRTLCAYLTRSYCE